MIQLSLNDPKLVPKRSENSAKQKVTKTVFQKITKEERAVGAPGRLPVDRPGRPVAHLADSRWARSTDTVDRQKTESKLF